MSRPPPADSPPSRATTRTQRSDEHQIRQVYRDHARAVQALASRLLHHDHAAAQDVVQETVQRAWRHPEVLTATPPVLRAWLLKVAKNIVVDRIRAADATRQRETSAAQDPTNAVGEGVAPDHADRVDTALTIADAVASLSRRPPRRPRAPVLPRPHHRGDRGTARDPAGHREIPPAQRDPDAAPPARSRRGAVTAMTGHDPQALTAHALGELSEPEARDLEAHLATCAACCHEWRAIRAVVDQLGELPPEFFTTELADPNDPLCQRIVRTIRRDKRTRLLRRHGVVAAAAAAVLIALASAFAAGRGHHPHPPTRRTAAPAAAAAGRTRGTAGQSPGAVHRGGPAGREHLREHHAAAPRSPRPGSGSGCWSPRPASHPDNGAA